MIERISLAKNKPQAGNKANGLIFLNQEGFAVPDGIVIDSDSFRQELARDGRLEAITAAVSELSPSNVSLIHHKISEIISGFSLSESLKIELAVAISQLAEGRFAVRSSASLEDGREGSFAGIYESSLRVDSLEGIFEAITHCYRSLYSERSLAYLASQKDLALEELGMAVIVQEMVEAQSSGVLFTAHPLLGLDRVMAIELTDGTAEHLVNGSVKPVSIELPWFDAIPSEGLAAVEALDQGPSEAALEHLRDCSIAIAERYAYPLDIEFAFDSDGDLHILQARPITSLRYDGIEGMWTTADFKDGGVSATVCRQYMWSLYELAWDYSLKRFLREGRLADENTEGVSAMMFFGRPYWNLNIVKQAMRKVPTFKEREFDEDYGISGNYEGDGETTAVSPRTIARFIPILFAQQKLLKNREKIAPSLKQELLDRIEGWHRQLDSLNPETDQAAIVEAWREIVFKFYRKSESSYFWQIFLNTIHQTLIRDSLLKYMDKSEYLSLLSGLDEVSHLLPFYELWDLSREIRADEAALTFWESLSSDEILHLSTHEASIEKRFSSLEAWFERYGYHSEKELDVSWPNFREDKEPIIRQLKEMISWSDDLGPAADQVRSRQAYEQTIDALRKKHGQRRAKKLEAKIDHMRQLLWWREEFRDISTRTYDLIRKVSLLLANCLYQEGSIDSVESIWQLKIEDIRSFLDGEMNRTKLQRLIYENERYYNAYRNFTSANELPTNEDSRSSEEVAVSHSETGERLRLRGTVASTGQVRGTARIVRSLDEIDRLQEGDILITRFTDTGWTVKFAILKGIVTEYGGVLSHAAIVSREYGIPAIVSATDAMEKIEDGVEVFLDAQTGEIWQKES